MIIKYKRILRKILKLYLNVLYRGVQVNYRGKDKRGFSYADTDSVRYETKTDN